MNQADFTDLKMELLRELDLRGKDFAAADDFLDEVRQLTRRVGRTKAMQIFARAGMIITKITIEEDAKP